MPACDSQHDSGKDPSPAADERSNRDEEKDSTQGDKNLRTLKELPEASHSHRVAAPAKPTRVKRPVWAHCR